MNSYELIKQQLSEENPDALLADGFDQALVGIGRRVGQRSLAIYDRNKCIQIIKSDLDSEEDAEEYFEYNVSGAWMGPNTPIFMATIRDIFPDWFISFSFFSWS